MQKAEASLQQVSIQTGTLFTVPDYENRIDMVLDIGRENWFHTVRMHQDDQNRHWWAPFQSGTAGPENFGECVGTLSFDEIVAAAERGVSHSGAALPSNIRGMLEASCAKGSRNLYRHIAS